MYVFLPRLMSYGVGACLEEFLPYLNGAEEDAPLPSRGHPHNMAAASSNVLDVDDGGFACGALHSTQG